MYHHYPVLHREIIQIIRTEVKREAIFVDCTLGLAGHSSLIIPLLPSGSYVFLLDKDNETIKIVKQKLDDKLDDLVKSKPWKDFKILNISFSEFFESFKFDKGFLVALADLGISYYQIKNQPGFSFEQNTFLDMRCDKSQSLTAFEIINNYPPEKLYNILNHVLQNGKLSFRIVESIVKHRRAKKIQTTYDLNKVISKIVSSKILKDTLQKVYLSLRIHVNQEDKELISFLEFFKKYKDDFLLMIISYHSIEGKIVKSFIKDTGFRYQKIKPTKQEIEENKPSRSAILWVIRR
ncbi:MAG: 16S rRNA (cytosine(1402)-N(4))-methyltransferase RsmH [Candidatus Calescibacterium sp.]|nr:16S rRNA (cytosine(1402)-N(4))-methyltransferase RsmH [Candidatus Calescibacterium sp.]MCX7972461.1 16S rRNA (cytosine(1402)-N(4))-methyltransferase RsmH [bacterium]MDW8195647.1 16S rRNA (cytosine(1402)-N(4))-methyltransferase RsmH [Candidatus Calescibacterium sp.]